MKPVDERFGVLEENIKQYKREIDNKVKSILREEYVFRRHCFRRKF